MTVPASLGPFDFGPYYHHTPAIRMTNATNAPDGCAPRQYSYWSTINHHRGRPDLYVFVQRTNLMPFVLRVKKATGQVSLLRELPWTGLTTGEGSYFSDTDPTKLYWLAGHELRTTNVETGQTETVFSLTPEFGGDDLWQAHSSADDSVHSATVRRRTNEGSYPKLGCVVYRNGEQRFFGVGDHDECQIDKSGRWLIVQKDDNDYIFDLDTDTLRVITNEQGALAHLDVGDGIMVGEDDQHEPSALVFWDLANPSAPRKLLHSTVWGPGAGHVAVRGGRWLLSSNATNELIEGPLGGSDPPRLICPGMLAVAPGMTDDEKYDRQLRACWDPLGEWASFISNVSDPHGRFDVFLVRVATTSSPPIIVNPPDPKPNPPGGNHPMGIPSYESLGGDAAAPPIGAALLADYAEAERGLDDGFAIWTWRTCYDALTMGVPASLRKHRREWRTELGLSPNVGGSTSNPQ